MKINFLTFNYKISKIAKLIMFNSPNPLKNYPNFDCFEAPDFEASSFFQETSEFAKNDINLNDLSFVEPKEPVYYFISPSKHCSYEAPNIDIFTPILMKERSNNDSIEKNDKPLFFLTRKLKHEGISSDNKKRRKKRCHQKKAFDNVLTKIQIHFINFVTDFVNDALKHTIKKQKQYFRKINYKFKSNISFNHFNELKNLKIKELLSQEISKKYKLIPKNANYELLLEVTSLSPWLKDFLNMNYLKAFSIYYNNCKPLKKVVFQGKEINLSSETKAFYTLLKRNKDLKDIMISTAQDAYFNGNKNLTKKFSVVKFNTEKKEN